MRAFLTLSLCLALLSVVGCSGQGTRNHSGSVGSGREAGMECQAVGRWVGMIPGGILAGRMLELTFYDNGMARGSSGSIVLDQSWTREGNVVSIVHVNSIPPAAACRVDYVGQYNLDFAEDCNSVFATSVEDLCEHRRRTIDGLRARRQ